MKILLLFFLSVFSFGGHCQSLPETVSQPELYDGQTIVFEGEVIGEAVRADDGYWVNCLDKGTAIGLFIEKIEQLEAITRFGSYAAQGDIVRVRGIFNRNCPVHNERDVHVVTLTVIEPGYLRGRSVPLAKTRAAAVLATICLTIIAIYFIKERYGKRNTTTAKQS